MNNKKRYEKVLRAFLTNDQYRPMRSRDMAKILDIPRDEFHDFRGALEDIRQEGLVQRGNDSRWRVAGKEKILDGVIDIAMAGHGFLLPDDPEEPDVFIPPDALLDAFDGDRVRIRVIDEGRRDRRLSGVVLEVLERARNRIVATMTASGKAVTDDPRNHFSFAIVFSPEAPEKSASQAAKSQRRRRNAEKAGQPAPKVSERRTVGDRPEGLPEPPPAGMKVLLEVVSWPSSPEGPRAMIIEVLGASGDPDTETAAILAENNAPGPFPPEVLNETRKLRRDISILDRETRLDLTDEIVCTIDPADARDFDDALSIKPDGEGGFFVDAHIADVAHYVPHGSLLDAEARERSTSIYLPERVIPMLPEELSNDMCSLRPNEERPAKTVRLHFDADANRDKCSIHRSLICSRKRFTYEEVRDLVLHPGLADAFPEKDVLDAVLNLHDLAMRLRKKRLANDAVELNLVEFRVVIDSEGHAERMEEVEHDFSHQLVEEFMLAANRAVAEWAAANGLPSLHRQHPAPKEERLEELAEFLTASGYAFKPPYSRKKLMSVVAKAKGRPEEHAINLMILKSFQQAVYGPDPDIGHFALNFPKYMHFTSPIRRYPDLYLHQMLDAAFAVGAEKANKLPKRLHKPVLPMDNLEQLGIHASERERRAMRIEEEVKDFRRLELLSRSPDRDFDAIVTGVKKFGIFVEIRDFLVESMIPRADLARLGYSTREELPPLAAGSGKKTKRKARHLAGDPGFHIGQTVRVRVRKIDLAARQCELEFLGVE